MEPIDWLQVILDYGKRFPNETTLDIGLIGVENVKLSSLQISISGNTLTIEKLYPNQFDNIIRRTNNTGFPLYWWGGNNSSLQTPIFRTWKPIPQHILLRLLTEGKEDLI